MTEKKKERPTAPNWPPRDVWPPTFNRPSLPAKEDTMESKIVRRTAPNWLPRDIRPPPSLPANEYARVLVFVGGLEENAKEEDLTKAFDRVGGVTKVELSEDTIRGKRTAFLTFATADQASRAIGEIPDPKIKGMQCWVAQVKESCKTLCIRKTICQEWREQVLQRKLAEYGVQNYEGFRWEENKRRCKKTMTMFHWGYAYLNFPSSQVAAEALLHLKSNEVLFGNDNNAEVEKADKYVNPDDGIMAYVKRVRLHGLSNELTRIPLEVESLLQNFGNIVKVDVADSIPDSSIRKDYCVVTFETREAAVACVHSINTEGLVYKGETEDNVWAALEKPKLIVAKESTEDSSVGQQKNSQTDNNSSRGATEKNLQLRQRDRYADAVHRKLFGSAADKPYVQSSGITRAAADKPSGQDDYGGKISAKQPSNYNESRGHDKTSGSKRPHSAMKELRHRNTERFDGRSSARFDRKFDTGSSAIQSSGISIPAAQRPSHGGDNSYKIYDKQPSNYKGSPSRDYNSASKRPPSAMEKVRPRYTEHFDRELRGHSDHRKRRSPSYRPHHGGPIEREAVRQRVGSARQFPSPERPDTTSSSIQSYGNSPAPAKRPPRQDYYSYKTYAKQSTSYLESGSRDYHSCSERSHYSAMEEVRPHKTGRFDQRSSALSGHENSERSHHSQRMAYASQPGHGESGLSSFRNSHGLSDTRTSTVEDRGREIDRRDGNRIHSGQATDYTSSDHPPPASDPSKYRHRRVNDGNSSSKRGSRQHR